MTGSSEMPAVRFMFPKQKRATELTVSRPTMAIIRPIKPEIQPLSGRPPEVRLPQMMMPNTASRNISCELNLSAIFVISGVNSSTQMMLITVPKNDEALATKMARPPLPCRASG